MFKKKVLALFLCIVMVTSTLVGCGSGKEDKSTEDSKTEGSTVTKESAVTEESNEVSFVFTKGGFEGAPENDIILQEIEKEANVTLNHIAPPAANYVEKVNIILSGKKEELPDLVKLQASMFNGVFDYVEQGALMDLTELVKDCPNILENIPKEALDRCTVDGKLYAIPVFCSPNRMNLVIRQDWLDDLGLKVPETLDELHNVLTAFTKEDPDKNGSDDTYGLTGASIETFEPIFGAFGMMAPVNSGVGTYWYEEDGKLKPQVTNPRAKEALTVLNQWYSEGIIDPEFVVIKNDSEINEKAMKNQFGVTYRWWTWEPKIEVEMQKIDPNVKFARIAPPIGADGESGLRGVSLINGAVIMLKGAKNPKAAMRLLDWLHTEKGMMTQYTGVEGVHWEKRADGTYHTLPQFNEDQKWIQWYSALENEWPLLQVETPLVQSRRDAFNWNVITNAGDGMITAAEKQYSTDLTTFATEAYTNFITGVTDLGEWDNFVSEWESRGGTEWTTQINEVYQNQNK